MEKPNPEMFLDLPVEQLREAGLSARKVEYAQGLSRALVDGDFELEQLPLMSDEQAIAQM